MSGLGWQLRAFGSGEHAHDEWIPQGPAIGWFEEHNLYLEPDAAYRTAAKFADEQGQALPLTQRSLFKAMESKGLIRSKNPGRFTLKIKLHDGSTKSVLHLYRVSPQQSGNSGNSGNQSQQGYDSQDENTVPTYEKAENRVGTLGTEINAGSHSAPSVPTLVPTQKPEWEPNQARNYRDDKDISGPVPEVPEVPTFPHPLPPQSFSGDEFPAVASGHHTPPTLTPPQFTVMTAIRTAGLLGAARPQIAEKCPRLGGAMVKMVLGELVTAGLVAEADGRYAVKMGAQP